MSRPSRVFGSPTASVSGRNFSTSPLKSSPLSSPPVIQGSANSTTQPLSGVKSSSSFLVTPRRIDSPPSSSELSLDESISSSNTSDDITIVPESGLEIENSIETRSNPISAPVLISISGDDNINRDLSATADSANVTGRPPKLSTITPDSLDGLMALSDIRSDLPTVSAPSTVSAESSSSSLAPLSCPICGDSMVSLLQLNRHLDDAHSETVTTTDNEQLKGWFMKKVEQAKQIQQYQTVTSVFSQSLNIFDDSGSDRSVSANGSGSPNNNGGTSTPKKKQDTPDPVTRSHWKKYGTGPAGKDKCSDPSCDKLLISRNGAVHCRQCGQLYCREHTLYQMKLSTKTARHDPDSGKGIWSRVCKTCYESRPGYTDNTGVMRDVSSYFLLTRQKQVDINELEVNKLEKRLIRLIRALADLDEGLFTYTTSIRRKSIEHQVAVWQDDKDVKNCPICSQKFGYSLRKHHCRVCGKVICADLGTDCSRDVPISVLSNKLDNGTNELPRRDDIGIRICRDCKRTIFAKRNFESEGNEEWPELLKIYDSMARIKHSIDITLPKFQEMLVSLYDSDNQQSHEVLHEATAIRRKMLHSFSQYDSMARRALTTEAFKETDKRLQKQIYQVAAQYLQDNMLPLKALPKALKHNKGVEVASSNSSVSEQDSRVSSPGPEPEPIPAPSLSEEEIQNYREQLIVMEEQKFMVENMISESKSRRKFDELIPLEHNLNDLKQEIEKIKNALGSYSIT